MIRILHIIWSAHFGGIGKLVLDLATTQLKDSEIQLGILICKKEGEFLEKFQEARLNCHFLYLNNGYDISPWKYLNALRIFRGYDILHFHGFNLFLAVCAGISRKKIIYTEHGLFGFGRKRNRADYIKAFFLKRFLNCSVDYISFVSQFTKRIAEKRYGLDGIEKSVIYNGIALKKDPIFCNGIEETILERIHGKFILGTTSRFAGFKRIDRLIQAFADFQINKDTVLLLVGDGILKDELERLVKQKGLSDKTIFTGFRCNIRVFQSLMDVCVFPSENEPFGLVAVETLSLGKPTIVFKDDGGIVEVVGDFSQDDVIEDIPHLVQRLERYYKNRNEIICLSQSRIEYSRRFDIYNMVAQFKNIYEGLHHC